MTACQTCGKPDLKWFEGSSGFILAEVRDGISYPHMCLELETIKDDRIKVKGEQHTPSTRDLEQHRKVAESAKKSKWAWGER